MGGKQISAGFKIVAAMPITELGHKRRIFSKACPIANERRLIEKHNDIQMPTGG